MIQSINIGLVVLGFILEAYALYIAVLTWDYESSSGLVTARILAIAGTVAHLIAFVMAITTLAANG